jgi:PAS domain-containing protein
MKEIRDYLTELEKISNDIINLEYAQNKTYQTLIDRIMLDCRTNIHPDVLVHLNRMKKINKVGYWVHDIRKKLFMATRELLQFLGENAKQDLFSENDFFNLIHPDDLARIKKSYAQDIFAHEDRSSAYRIITSKAELKFVVSYFSSKYDEHDNPIQVTGIIFEIPQAEDLKYHSTQITKNEIISANMNVGFWEYDPENDSEYWSSSLYDIIETTPEKFPPKTSSLSKLIPPKYLSRSMKIIEEGNNQNIDYELTFKIKTLKGKEKIVFTQVHHLLDINGNLIKRYGLIYDVTKIKQLLIK